MKRVKYALVQGGGGFKGTFQLGALNFINENWKEITGLDTPMSFDINTGVSVGALNGVMIAMGKLPELNNLWLNQVANNGVSEIYTSEFIDTDNDSERLKFKVDVKAIMKKLLPNIEIKLGFFEKLGLVFSRKKRKNILDSMIQKIEIELKTNAAKIDSIADNMPLRRKMEKLIDRSLIKGIFKCGFASLNTGIYHSVKHSDFLSNEQLINGVMASTSIPAIWKPVESVKFYKDGSVLDSKYNVDGGIMNMSPLGDAIKMINEDQEDCVWKIIVINCHSGVPNIIDASQKSIFQLAARSLYELSLNEIFNNDIDHFLEINRLVKQTQAWDYEIVLHNRLKQVIKNFEAVIINPLPTFDMGNPLVSTKRLVKQRFDQGYIVAASQNYLSLKNI